MATPQKANPAEFSLLKERISAYKQAKKEGDVATQQNLRRLTELEKEKEDLQKKLNRNNKVFKKMLGKPGNLAVKMATNNKPTDRLSGQNSHRVAVLIIVAIIFDMIQMVVIALDIIPIVGFVFTATAQILIWMVSKLVFFILWHHYKISFIERFLSKKVSIIKKAALITARLILFLINLILPVTPDIIVSTISSIYMVNIVDRRNKKEKRLMQIEFEILETKHKMQ